MEEYVKIAKIASANENNLHQFIYTFSCLPTPARPNTSTKFRLIDASKSLLLNLPLPLILTA